MSEARKLATSEVTFTGQEVKIVGLPEEFINSPDKIREVMEVLNLPEGTEAQISVTYSTSMIR